MNGRRGQEHAQGSRDLLGRRRAARRTPEPARTDPFPPYPDQGLPGEQPRPDHAPRRAAAPDQGLPGDQPQPSHPIYLPPYIDNSLPATSPPDRPAQPVIDNSLPEIEEIGLSDEQIEKLKGFLEGNLPETGGPDPDPRERRAVRSRCRCSPRAWTATGRTRPSCRTTASRCSPTPRASRARATSRFARSTGEVVDSGTITVK